MALSESPSFGDFTLLSAKKYWSCHVSSMARKYHAWSLSWPANCAKHSGRRYRSNGPVSLRNAAVAADDRRVSSLLYDASPRQYRIAKDQPRLRSARQEARHLLPPHRHDLRGGGALCGIVGGLLCHRPRGAPRSRRPVKRLQIIHSGGRFAHSFAHNALHKAASPPFHELPKPNAKLNLADRLISDAVGRCLAKSQVAAKAVASISIVVRNCKRCKGPPARRPRPTSPPTSLGAAYAPATSPPARPISAARPRTAHPTARSERSRCRSRASTTRRPSPRLRCVAHSSRN